MFVGIIEDIALLDENLDLQHALLGENGEWTIQVIYPKESTPVPTISDAESLISVEQNEPVETSSNFLKPKNSEHWTPNGYECPNCYKLYTARKNLVRHINLECGKEPRFMCPYCDYRNHRRNEIKKHCRNKHANNL